MNMDSAPREQVDQTAWYRRSAVPAHIRANNNLITRYALWLYPWTVRNYPGHRRGVMATVNIANWERWRHYERGRTPLPLDIARKMADYLSSRIATGLMIIKELEAYIAECEARPKHGKGFREVKNRDGIVRDARHRSGNKPAK